MLCVNLNKSRCKCIEHPCFVAFTLYDIKLRLLHITIQFSLFWGLYLLDHPLTNLLFLCQNRSRLFLVVAFLVRMLLYSHIRN